MTSPVVVQLADEMASVIEKIIDRQEALHAVIQEKLEAMRRADVEAMIRAASKEGEVVGQMTAMDEERREVSSRLAKALGLGDAGSGRGPRLRAMAARLEGPAGGRLSALAGRLREKMLKAAQANRVVELVSRQMLGFFKGLFSAMVQDGESAPIYSPVGALDRRVAARVLDAMG